MKAIQVKVGISDYKITKAPNKLITIGLGSCIGIAIYDLEEHLGGLAHVMLYDSKQFKDRENKAKYADLAVPMLIEQMIKAGAKRENLKIKIVGGASMFNFKDSRIVSKIGEKNYIAVKREIERENIEIVSEHIGGNKSRTVTLNPLDGSVTLKIVGLGTLTI